MPGQATGTHSPRPRRWPSCATASRTCPTPSSSRSSMARASGLATSRLISFQPAISWDRPRWCSSIVASASWCRATTSAGPMPPALRSSRCPATSSSPKRPSRSRSSSSRRRRGDRQAPAFAGHLPRAYSLGGVYALGKCQRVIKLLRAAGYDQRIWLHGALASLCKLYQDHGVDLGDIALVSDAVLETFKGAIVLCPPSAIADRWSRRFFDPIPAMASAG